jgi:hypothetical protein
LNLILGKFALKKRKFILKIENSNQYQCCGAGAAWSRIILVDLELQCHAAPALSTFDVQQKKFHKVYQFIFNILFCFVVEKGPAQRQASKWLRKVKNPDPGFFPNHNTEVLHDSAEELNTMISDLGLI